MEQHDDGKSEQATCGVCELNGFTRNIGNSRVVQQTGGSKRTLLLAITRCTHVTKPMPRCLIEDSIYMDRPHHPADPQAPPVRETHACACYHAKAGNAGAEAPMWLDLRCKMIGTSCALASVIQGDRQDMAAQMQVLR